MDPYRYRPGRSPLLVSIPHAGTQVPPEMAARMTEAAQALPDTDWHVDRLYDFLEDLDASVLAATQSRFVIDLNRAPDGAPLYPGASNTELCPTTTFDEQPVYRAGEGPDEAEVAARRARVWRPYHERLQAALEAIKARHGVALLWDAHSIRSRVPRFFEGRLPDLNFGTGGGATADPELVARLADVATASGYSHAVNGRFKGGYITRAYGRPAEGAHAVQLELSQIIYMDEAPPYGFREDLAAGIRPALRRLLESAVNWVYRRGRLARG
ncbi:MAG: N-formylglutamate deformylase [Rhodospirillales bacterium]|nr:N-formylglutamate deformylase [Rhodospirillales bacterium]MDH3910156.1 N-formylglutamate deformylase [Rhodospirillales bacterium]MDH3918780.1 N-formylglutamate deformylase [Rhodospirillales bacterium]MDH3966211.1 N-formylglutamate deformylase [Rhodospirillales bacterium]